MESLKSETVKYLLYALVMVGFLIALINNFDAFMEGVNAGIDDVFRNSEDRSQRSKTVMKQGYSVIAIEYKWKYVGID